MIEIAGTITLYSAGGEKKNSAYYFSLQDRKKIISTWRELYENFDTMYIHIKPKTKLCGTTIRPLSNNKNR